MIRKTRDCIVPRRHRQAMPAIARWPKPGGRLSVHIFTHREYAWPLTPAGLLHGAARLHRAGRGGRKGAFRKGWVR